MDSSFERASFSVCDFSVINASTIVAVVLYIRLFSLPDPDPYVPSKEIRMQIDVDISGSGTSRRMFVEGRSLR